jgi:ubiquinone/menaquinone biosynthesis C-methylase UbiE
VVFAVEPVENLRRFLKTKAHKHGFHNFYAVDGLISDLPFPQYFADVVICGHVFGDQPRAEFQEMKRITQKGGMIILCPGSNGSEEQAHQFLVEQGFNWNWFIEPPSGRVRKYWITVQ